MLNSPHTYVGVVSDFFVAPPLAKPPDNHKPLRSAQGPPFFLSRGLFNCSPMLKKIGGLRLGGSDLFWIGIRLIYHLECLTRYMSIIGDYLRYTSFPARASFRKKCVRKTASKLLKYKSLRKCHTQDRCKNRRIGRYRRVFDRLNPESAE